MSSPRKLDSDLSARVLIITNEEEGTDHEYCVTYSSTYQPIVQRYLVVLLETGSGQHTDNSIRLGYQRNEQTRLPVCYSLGDGI